MWAYSAQTHSRVNRPVISKCSSYQVIVYRVKSWGDEIPERYKQGLLDYEKAREVNQEFYIAAEFSSPSIHPSLTFEIGDGKNYGNYENVALLKPNKYKIYTRAVTSDPKVSLHGKNIYFSFFLCYLFAVCLDFLSYAPVTASLTSSSFSTVYDERRLTLIPLPNDYNPCHSFLVQLESLFFFSILYSFSSANLHSQKIQDSKLLTAPHSMINNLTGRNV